MGIDGAIALMAFVGVFTMLFGLFMDLVLGVQRRKGSRQ